MNTVPSDLKIAIKPSDILIKDLPPFLAMSETLEKPAHEVIVVLLVSISQNEGQWVGLIYEERIENDRNLAEMVEFGFFTEKQVKNGWLYELTPFAIETIYLEQSKRAILQLKIAVMHAHGFTIWARMRKLFTPPSTFT